MNARVDDLLAAADQAIRAYKRTDLADRLERTRRRLDDPYCRVVVVGEYKKGKSSLINALLNSSTCPVDVDVATAVPTVVRYSDQPCAFATWDSPDGDPHEEPVDLASVAGLAIESGDRERVVRGVEVGVPRRMLRSGLALVDTPGVGGLASLQQASTLAALPTASAVVFVTDASRELTRSELDFLGAVAEACPRIIGVITKIDFYPAWRDILDLDRSRLAERSLPLDLLPVSSPLRRRAVANSDADLNAESGFGGLVAEIQRVVGHSRLVSESAAATDMIAVLGELRAELRARLDVLEDPRRSEQIIAELAAATAAAEQLRTKSAGWQTVLNDGLTDLSSEVDHHLRARFRALGSDADKKLDEADPAEVWGEFEPWIAARVASEITENFTLLREVSDGVASKVAELFATEAAAIHATAGLEPALPAGTAVAPDFAEKSVGARGLTAVRGSYGGILMFGMFANLAGLTLLGPVAPVIGVVLGRKALKEERERELSQRRQQAKVAYRKYCDDALSSVGKESRDAVRRVSRELRDHFSTLAKELQDSTAAALSAAQQASEAHSSDTGRQRTLLSADIERLDHLLAQLEQFRAEKEGSAP